MKNKQVRKLDGTAWVAKIVMVWFVITAMVLGTIHVSQINAELKAAQQNLKAEVVKAESLISEKDHQLAKAQGSYADLSQEAQKLEADKAALKEQAEELEAQRKALDAKYSAAESEKQALAGEVSSLKKLLRTLE